MRKGNEMTAKEEVVVKDGVDQETVDAVAAVSTYKYGWDTESEQAYAPRGEHAEPERSMAEKHAFDFRKERRARVDDRMASASVFALGKAGRAGLGDGGVS